MQNEDTAGWDSETKIASVDASILRRIFRYHLLALIVTAFVVLAMLTNITTLPKMVAVSLCSIVVCSLIVFPFLIAAYARNCDGLGMENRFAYMTTSVGISFAQMVFVLPVFACVITPAVNFKAMLFGLV